LNLEQIPRTFWHSASLSLLVFTFGFLYISFSLGDLKVKFKDLEFRSTAVTVLESTLDLQRKNISKQAATIAERVKEVDELKGLLEGKIEQVDSLKQYITQLESESTAPREARRLVKEIKSISEDKDFARKVVEKQRSQFVLQTQQQQLQQSYQSQKDAFEQIQQQQVQQKWAPK